MKLIYLFFVFIICLVPLKSKAQSSEYGSTHFFISGYGSYTGTAGLRYLDGSLNGNSIHLEFDQNGNGNVPKDFVLTNHSDTYPVSSPISMYEIHPGEFIGTANYLDGSELTVDYIYNSDNYGNFTIDIDVYGTFTTYD